MILVQFYLHYYCFNLFTGGEEYSNGWYPGSLLHAFDSLGKFLTYSLSDYTYGNNNGYGSYGYGNNGYGNNAYGNNGYGGVNNYGYGGSQSSPGYSRPTYVYGHQRPVYGYGNNRNYGTSYRYGRNQGKI